MRRDSPAWEKARAKRLSFSGFVEGLEPNESPASGIVRRGGRAAIEGIFGRLDDNEVEHVVHDLDFWARREQVPPDKFKLCFAMCGRGFGKSWMGSRWVIKKAQQAKTIGVLVGATAADVRDTMVRGPSGILALSPPWFMPRYEPSKRRLTWPNGVYAICYSADRPDRLRGPNAGWCWGDEPASWKHEMAAVDQLPLVLRIGTKQDPPQLLLTGTPRPLKKIEEMLFSNPETQELKPGVVLRTGSTLNNAANLAPDAVANMRALANTRWGQQEVLGKLLMDVPGAIFGGARWRRVHGDAQAYARRMDRRIVTVDPSPTSDTGSDESGIIVEGVRGYAGLLGADGAPLKHVSVLADLSMRGSPREWITVAIRAYIEWDCDALVVEVNTGGEMVVQLVETVAAEMGVHVNVKPVRATSAKSKRAEPVSALAEAGRIEFVGRFPRLEAQLAKFTGIAGRRDDRADAFCWGIHDLVFGESFFCV